MRVTAAPPRGRRSGSGCAGGRGRARRPRRARPRSAGRARARRAGRGRARRSVAPAARRVVEQPSSGGPERPDDGARAGDADRAVAVLEGGVGLGPRLGRLAQLQRRLAGQPDGPAAAEERPPVGLARLDRQRSVERGWRRRATEASRSTPSCARSSVSAVVAKRVCTTDCSSAKSSTTTSSAASATGESGDRGDRDRARAGRAHQRVRDLGGRARARERDDDVVARRAGISEAANASVRPWPVPSRSAA